MRILKYQANTVDEEQFRTFMVMWYGEELAMERLAWGCWY